MSLDDFNRVPLLFGPSPVHPLPRLTEHLGGEVEIWAKREDCNSGLAYGGNKVRKLEYLAAEDVHITFGWAALPEDGVGALELFRKADDRLYAAKLIQRNHRVVQQLASARH